MTIKKLLAGVALTALVAGGAYAQDNFTAATGDLRTDRDFAAEYDGGIGDNAIFTHDADNADYDNLGAAAVVDITISTTGGLVLGEIVDDADFTEGSANCSFTVQAGGGIGSTSVTFRNDGADFRACANDTTFDIDLTRSAANHSQDSGATVTVTCSSDCGTFVAESDTFTLIDDTSVFPTGSQDVTAAATVTLDTDGIGPVGPHTLGNVDFDFDGTGIFTDGDGVTIGGVAGIVVGDAVASAELEIDFPGGDDGVATVAVDVGGAVACTEDAGAGVNTWSCALSATQLDTLLADGEVTFTSDNTDPIAQQTPTAMLTVTANADYAAPGSVSGSLAPIEWDDGLSETAVATGGPREWVRFGSGGTESNFRIQLASDAAAADITQVQVAVAAGNGVPAGTVLLNAGTADTGFQVKGSTITFNSRALGAAAGATGNADITGVMLQTLDADVASAGGADMNRQLVNRTPGSFVATGGMTDN
ncbi:hypothetical protein [Hyphobacterium sp.]|uniref:hypothetical protein n=1 Tax=Hyphobacterium sp. TaxID=2004662 RepID=UPI003B515E0A